MLKIYNTLSRKKEEFIPSVPNAVSMYVCGPTVYDYFHIGNARSFINADFIRRYLEYKKFKVNFIMNVTDIDDKIIRKANSESVPAAEIAKKYTDYFFEDIAKLKIKPATLHPTATSHIDEIIRMITILVEKGFAYQTGDGVYYDIGKFPSYGKLSGKNIDDLQEGARVEVNEQKKSPLDFALWKFAKKGEPYWECPWGNGRPGWHIECSAMSGKHLGATFDIHAGGSDLIFPHHENEIAQSEAANGAPFARYWMHFGFLNIDNEKMSKSLGNFKTARDILKKYPAEVIRFLFAQTHYAAPLDFSDAALESSVNGLSRLQNLFDRIDEMISHAPDAGEEPFFPVQDFYSAFEEAMDDDFNSPKGMAVIFDFVSGVNKVFSVNDNPPKSFLLVVKEFLMKSASGIFDILTVDKVESSHSSLDDDLINLLIKIRIELKKHKQYQLSDMIRDELIALGITLQDLKDRTTYKRS